MRRTIHLLPLLAVACGHGSEPTPEQMAAPNVVNVYSHRHYDTDKQLFDAFTKKTGITVNMVMADDDDVLARLEAEGEKSPCDVLITSDGGRLGLAKSRGLLQASNSEVLQANIPANLRDPDGYWYGLTMRARVVAYNKNKVQPSAIATYDDLTGANWKGRVLVRSSENAYNQSLVAAMIARNGPEAAATWARGIVANMAREPKGNDTDQMLAIAEGIGDVAIVNSYYAAKLLASSEPEKQKAREVIGVIFPSMGSFGTHVNVSGGGVAKNAKHPAEAVTLLEFLSGDEAQALFGAGNKEYPAKAGVPVPVELQAFGAFTADTLRLEALGRFNADAVKVLDDAGWH